MKEKLRAALNAIQWEPATQVKRSGDYYIATLNVRGQTRRGIATTRAEAVKRALVGK